MNVETKVNESQTMRTNHHTPNETSARIAHDCFGHVKDSAGSHMQQFNLSRTNNTLFNQLS